MSGIVSWYRQIYNSHVTLERSVLNQYHTMIQGLNQKVKELSTKKQKVKKPTNTKQRTEKLANDTPVSSTE